MASTLPDSIPSRASTGDARRSYAATLKTTNNTSTPCEGMDRTVPTPRTGHICLEGDQRTPEQQGDTALGNPRAVGSRMQSTMHTDLAQQALIMAVWRRKPPAGLLVHSDQGMLFTGHDWQDFLKAHGLISSMSRRGNCHDNAVAESFFQLLKREHIKRRIYVTRDEAKSNVFNCIEMFYNTRRQHGRNNGLSPVEFEKQQSK